MKRFKTSKILILLSFIVITLLVFSVGETRADSGFDGSYGGSYGGSSYGGSSYGGSSWSSGGSWGSSSHHYNSSSGSSSSGTESKIATTMEKIVLYFFGIIGLIIILKIYFHAIWGFIKDEKNKKIRNMSNPASVSFYAAEPYGIYDINKIKELILDFDEDKFKTLAFEIYKDIQIAWMNFDYDAIKKITTDEMYNMYKAQLQTLKVKNEVNVMKNIEFISSKIVGMDISESIISLTVNMTVECFDYIERNGVVVRGNNRRKVVYNYQMVFNTSVNKDVNKCPNCGAPLDNVNSTTCPYCESYIINKNYDWVLAKKKVITQHFK